jgi:hypothetical protein
VFTVYEERPAAAELDIVGMRTDREYTEWFGSLVLLLAVGDAERGLK